MFGRLRFSQSLLVAIAFAGALILKVADPDTFMHTALGHAVAHGALPWHDTFSFAPGFERVRYAEALAQLVFYAIVALAGFAGLTLVHALASGTLLYRIVQHKGATSSLSPSITAALVASASFAAMSLKPQIFSYVLFASLPWLLRTPRPLVTLVFFVLWANLHRGGILGLAVVLGCAAARASYFERENIKKWFTVGIAAFVGVVMNPGGVFYLHSAFDVAGRESFRAHIAEWQPLTWDAIQARHLALVPLLLVAVPETWKILRARRECNRWLPNLLAFTLAIFAARNGVRLLPFLAIACAPFALRTLRRIELAYLRRRRATPLNEPRTQWLLSALTAALLYASLAAHVPTAYRGLGEQRLRVPSALVTFLQTQVIPAHIGNEPINVYNSFGFGGYLMWRIAASSAQNTKIFIDGRNDTLYRNEQFLQSLRADTDSETFYSIARRHHVHVACFAAAGLIPPQARFLLGDPAWSLVYADDIGLIFIEKSAFSSEVANRLGYTQFARTETVFSRVVHLGDAEDDRVLWQELLRNAREAPESMSAHYGLALAARARNEQSTFRREQAVLAQLAADRGIDAPPL